MFHAINSKIAICDLCWAILRQRRFSRCAEADCTTKWHSRWNIEWPRHRNICTWPYTPVSRATMPVLVFVRPLSSCGNFHCKPNNKRPWIKSVEKIVTEKSILLFFLLFRLVLAQHHSVRRFLSILLQSSFESIIFKETLFVLISFCASCAVYFLSFAWKIFGLLSIRHRYKIKYAFASAISYFSVVSCLILALLLLFLFHLIFFFFSFSFISFTLCCCRSHVDDAIDDRMNCDGFAVVLWWSQNKAFLRANVTQQQQCEAFQ